MQPYTQKFYKDQSVGSRRSAEAIVPLVLTLIKPQSVIDVGCGLGIWLSVFKEFGVKDVFGIDGDHVDRSMLQIPNERFTAFDLKKPIPINRQFDLVISLEVAEHLPEDCAKTFIHSLTGLGPVILFSAAIPFQGGTNHLNEQWPDYWANHFNDNGYEESANSFPSTLSIVHPKKYLEIVSIQHATRDLAALISPGETFILVDQDLLREHLALGRHAIPFLERDGQYWGPPADDETAIRELTRLRQSGAKFLVFAWPAFWWLDYYEAFRQHLVSNFRCMLRNDRLVAFNLKSKDKDQGPLVSPSEGH